MSMMTEKIGSPENLGLAAAGALKGVYEVLVHEPLSHPQPNTQESRSATKGWIGLGAAVLAWDIFARETLSEGVDRALERNKLLTLAGIGVTALHLANALPESVDPIHQGGKRLRNLIRGA